MAEEKYIGMTLGENFGHLVMQIAVEKLMKYDIEGAMKIFTDIFPGMDDDMAFRLLTGSMVMDAAEDGVRVNVRERDWDYDTHPYFDTDYFIAKHSDILFKKEGYFTCEEEFLRWMSSESNMGSFTVSIDSEDLFRKLLNDDFSECFKNMSVTITTYRLVQTLEAHNLDWTREFIDLCDDSRVLQDFLQKYVFFKETLQKLEGFYKVSKFFEEQGYEFSDSQKRTIRKIEDSIMNLEKQWNSFKLGSKSRELAQSVSRYMKSTSELERYVSDIHPVDLDHEYDAYWVAQDGTAYGASGSSGLMLHIQMADAICKKKGYEKRSGEDSSLTLEKLGYMKIHSGWVLYSGYEAGALMRKEIPISDVQVRFLEQFAEKFYDGKLQFGYTKESRTVSRMTMKDYEELLNL